MNPPPDMPAPAPLPAKPRLVLISGEGGDLSASLPPNRILGSEPRVVGGFRLTDR